MLSTVDNVPAFLQPFGRVFAGAPGTLMYPNCSAGGFRTGCITSSKTEIAVPLWSPLVGVELTTARLQGECSTAPPQVDHFMEDALTVYCPESSDSSGSQDSWAGGALGSLAWSGSLESRGW